jgi:signal transduction histidine kinase
MSVWRKDAIKPLANFERRRAAVTGQRRGRKRTTATWLARILGLDALTQMLGRLSVAAATALIVAVSMTSTRLVSYVVWWFTSGMMNPTLIPISAVIAFLVATPIAAYLVTIIHSLARSREELTELTQQLVVARDLATEANEAKSHFLASTSHELRTPLNAIIGFSEIVRDELFGPCGEQRYVEYAKDIHMSGTHLLSLINDILDLSKIEAGQAHIDTGSTCDLTDTISEAAKVIGVLAEKAGVELRLALSSTAIAVRANDRMIRQVVLNILSNAVKFTPEGGCVTVSTGIDSFGDVSVGVADTGIGLTDEELRVATQPFGQVDSRLSRRHVGTGLGLSLTKAMVELHGGTLTIRSASNEGTTVTFTIPKERVIEINNPLAAATVAA